MWPNSFVDSDYVVVSPSGEFSYDYQLPVTAVQGTYTFEVFNVTRTVVVASQTFTDGAIHFSQCRNDSNDDALVDDCSWGEGAINQSNSVYEEADSIPQRLFNVIDAAGSHTMVFEYDFTKGDTYAYDFLTDVDETQSGVLLVPCADAPAFATQANECDGSNTLYSGASLVTIASDHVRAGYDSRASGREGE